MTVTQSYIRKTGRGEIRVCAEFPDRADEAAEREFMERLKELYLQEWERAHA